MDKSECRVGLRVRLRENFYGTSNRSGALSDGLTLPAGATGRVVRDSSGRESVSVDFDRPFQFGYDCGGVARDGHGWNIVPEALDPEDAQRSSGATARRPAVGDRVMITEGARRKYERSWSVGTLTTDERSRLPFLVVREGGGDELWLREDEVTLIVEGAAQPTADSTVASQAPAAQATPKPWPLAEQVASLARDLAERVHLAEAARDEALRQLEATREAYAAELVAAREEARQEARCELLAEVARVRAAKLGAQANGCGGRFAGLEVDDEPSVRGGAN